MNEPAVLPTTGSFDFRITAIRRAHPSRHISARAMVMHIAAPLTFA